MTPEEQSHRHDSLLTVRNAHILVYDAAAKRMLAFGGADESRVRDDTWRWDPASRTWRLVTATGPGPRTFPAAAYDEARREVVLFGGNSVLFGKEGQFGTFLGDTWSFRDGRWRRREVAGPPQRAEAVMAYDTGRRRVVLFGGYERTAAGTQRFGDTWEWDGTRWTLMTREGPSPRNGAALAFDRKRSRTVLFGGNGPSNETWEWDGVSWRQVPSGEVPGRFNPAMTYDIRRSTLVRFGGWTGKVRADDTWRLDATGWIRVPVSGPDARNHASMAYDSHRGRAVLFGGHDGDNVFGDTWEWDGGAWTRVGTTAPRKRADNGH